jgi:hypothetical protein
LWDDSAQFGTIFQRFQPQNHLAFMQRQSVYFEAFGSVKIHAKYLLAILGENIYQR